jgi:hypothetical protein
VGSALRRCQEDIVALCLGPNLHHLFEAYSATPSCEAYSSRFGQVMGKISPIKYQAELSRSLLERVGIQIKYKIAFE